MPRDATKFRPASPEEATFAEPPGGTPDLPRPDVGASIGRYVVLEEVGRGGMGRVLRAYDPKLQREVALKVLRGLAALGHAGTQRLVNEARAMAMLSHSNVVAIYDVEEAEHDRVVLVMEYVAGQTLTPWLEAGHGWQEVLGHFQQAGRGLAAAHAAGLLHRDFKPANVLVAATGIVKVTDFGLAKFCDHDTANSDSGSRFGIDPTPRRSEGLTEAGTVMGTPRYMAPEQHLSELLTPAADQYAFCVALWEALTGAPPFSGKNVPEQKLKGPPAWPGGPTPRAVAEAVRRGLAADPSERWPHMDALLQALAHDRSRARTRWLRIVAAVGALAAGLAGVGAWWAARAQRCTQADAAEHLQIAWNDARRADVQGAMLAVGTPYTAGVWTRTEQALDGYAGAWQQMRVEACEATTLRGEQSTAAMDLRMACLGRAKVELRAVVSELAQSDAETVEHAYEMTAGLPPLSRCADMEALQAEVEPPLPHEAEAVATIREHIAQAGAADTAGHFEAARRGVEAAQAVLEGVAYAPVRAEVAIARGDVLDHLGEYAQAEATLREGLRLAVATRQWEQLQRAATRLMFVVGNEQQRFAEAMHYVDIARGSADTDPEQQGALSSAIANLLYAQGDYEAAEVEGRRALALWSEVLGADDPDLASAHNNLGAVLEQQGRYDDAEAEYRAALAIEEEVLGPEHPAVATSLNNLAALQRAQGKYDDAEAYDRRALAIRETSLGADHPYVAQSLNNLAGTLLAQGRATDAEVALRRALEVRRKTLAADHPAIAQAHGNLGHALWREGRYDEALAQHRLGLTLKESSLDRDQLSVATSLNDIAVTLEALRRYEEAELEHRRALAIKARELGPHHLEIAVSRSNLGYALWRLHKYDEAEAEHRRALAIREKALGVDHPDVATSHTGIANALRSQGKSEQAEAEFRLALALQVAALGEEHPDLATTRNNLADTLLERGAIDEARVLAEAAWTRRGRDDMPAAHQAQTAFLLARVLWEGGDRVDRPRARELAEQARAGYAGVGTTVDDEKAADIAAWLAAHR